MLELRFDPIKNEYVALATRRQGRTFFPPKNFCPLCPTKNSDNPTEIPEKDYDILVFENKFPTFSSIANEVKQNHYKGEILKYKKEKSLGICEVIIYSSNHDLFLEDMPEKRVSNIIKVWQDRYYELGNSNFIKYILIFENKGKEIGVTLTHPHGQIYAFPFIPPIPQIELNSSKGYFIKNKRCIHCDMIDRELKEKDRLIFENEYFAIFIPYYAKWPYEVHIYPLRHSGTICNLNSKEVSSLAAVLQELISRYNKLFNFRMPYVMIIHQNPTDEKKYEYYHMHFEFYPPYRTASKLKYMAGVELATGIFINDTLPEEKASELRNIRI
jgi:UDPglucose--hexose-1-phosphate uridylyltransferase